MIDVEVRGRFGQYIKAVLCNVVNDEAIVSYPQSQQEERVRLTEVRLPPSGTGNVTVGQSAEVLFSVQETPNGQSGDSGLSAVTPEDSGSPSSLNASSCRANHLELPAWWPCHVQRVRDEVAVVKLEVQPQPNASATDQAICNQLSNITDIVNKYSLRQMVTDTSHLTPDAILRHCIEIPKELADFASDTTVHTEFVKHCGGPASLFYDSEAGCLVVLSTDKDTIDNVVLLEDTHLKMLRQKWAITRSLRQTMRSLEGNRVSDGVRSTLTHSRSSGDWDGDSSVVIEKFYVPQRLMGLAIGSRGANIRSAREIPGVISIRVRETNVPVWRGGHAGVEPVGDSGDALITVEAKTPEAAKEARAKLEFVELYLGVPQRYVARLIGRRTANILSVVEKSGVVSINLDNQTQSPSDDEEVLDIGNLNLNYPGAPSNDMRRIFLRRPESPLVDDAGASHAVTQQPTDERYCGFILSGTRESVEKARLLINFQLDYIYDLEKMEADNLEIMRSLNSDAGFGHSGRGYSDGPGRWGGVRGPGRSGLNRRSSGRGGTSQGTTADNSFNSNHLPERDNGVGAYPAYPSGRRPSRGGARPYNGDTRGRRGRGATRTTREYRDWQDQTGSNGDVMDRRRGSEDSDELGNYFGRNEERPDVQMDPNDRPRKHIDHDQTAPNIGQSQEVDDGYRASDESGPGENGVQSNGGPRIKGSNNSVRQRGGYERGGSGSRPPRGRRADRQRGGLPATGTRT